jgi:hypothetical protein
LLHIDEAASWTYAVPGWWKSGCDGKTCWGNKGKRWYGVSTWFMYGVVCAKWENGILSMSESASIHQSFAAEDASTERYLMRGGQGCALCILIVSFRDMTFFFHLYGIWDAYQVVQLHKLSFSIW